MIKTQYKDYTVEVFNDKDHLPDSKDYTNKYDISYGTKTEYAFTSSHGIKVFNKNGSYIKSAVVSATAGATGIYEHSFVIKDNLLLICCCNEIFCLELPTLKLEWQKEVDSATCFEIFINEDDFIVRGEMQISRINNEGDILWQYGGRDIFVTEEGVDDFYIFKDRIVVKDWLNNIYNIDIETGNTIE